MDEASEGVTIHRVPVWFSSSLSTWVPVNPPLIPDSQLDTLAPSEWQAALTLRNFPLLSVSQSWLEITGPQRKHSPPSYLKSLSNPVFLLLFITLSS